jgi:branched-chain amino acid transport system substrate-binding protein
MSDDERTRNTDEQDLLAAKGVSRRDFLKLAGIAGATVSVGAGLGGLLSACGGGTTTTSASAAPTTGATTATTAAASSSTTAAEATTTTAAAAAEAGREIKLGFVTPLTGPLASFGVPDTYCVDRWKQAIGDGIVCGDKKKHPVSITVQDTQSDSNRSAQVAGDLINNTKIDMMMVASTPDTVTPTVEQCEANETPVVSTDCPWQTYLGKNFKTGYKWSYHVFFGGEDWMTVNVKCYDQIQTNKTVAYMLPNDADGNYYREVYPGFLEKNGYKPVDGGAYQNGTEDYSSVIAEFKKAGAEIVTGVMIPPDFTNFWKQSMQQGWQPKVSLVGKALLFPQSVDALGDIGNGQLTELWWHRTFPFKSSLSGETCAQLADDFEAKTGQQQTAPLLHYVVGEMAIQALKNAADPTDKASILAAVEKLKLDTIVGPIDFGAPVMTPLGPGNSDFPAGPGHKTKNVFDHGLGGAQWLMKGGKWKFELIPVSNAGAPYLTEDKLTKVQQLPIK